MKNTNTIAAILVVSGLFWAFDNCCPAWADSTAHFTLRLAAGQSDAVLVLGDSANNTLELEVWVELTNVTPGVRVQAFSEFLKVSSNGVITYNGDYESPPFAGLGCVFNGTDNSPYEGDFSPACFAPLGTTAGIDAPALYGTFSVTAIGPGTVSYIFDDTGGTTRPWSVNLDDLSASEGGALSCSIEPPAEFSEVVTVLPSADVVDDGDVDLADYRRVQSCAPAIPGPLPTGECESADINRDDMVNVTDVEILVAQMTGARALQGDLDIDGDVDLADFARFQICLLKSNDPPLLTFCAHADTNRDGSVNDDDYTKFAEKVTGPR